MHVGAPTSEQCCHVAAQASEQCCHTTMQSSPASEQLLHARAQPKAPDAGSIKTKQYVLEESDKGTSLAIIARVAWWEPVTKALSDNGGSGNECENVFEFLHRNMDLDKLLRLFLDDVDSALRETTRHEKLRKDEEWRRTKMRLEQRMEAEMEQRKAGKDKGQNIISEGANSDKSTPIVEIGMS